MKNKRFLKYMVSVVLAVGIGFGIFAIWKYITPEDYSNLRLNNVTTVLINGVVQTEKEKYSIKEWKKNIISILKNDFEKVGRSLDEIDSIVLDVRIDNYEEYNEYYVTMIVLTATKPKGFSIITKFTGYDNDLPGSLMNSKDEIQKKIITLKSVQSNY